MPDSKISALPSATVPLAGTEVLPIVQSSVTDKVTAADLLRQNGQTVTTSNPVLSLAQTWNAGGVTFTGMALAITDTASSSSSLLALMTVGGNTKFKIDKEGTVDSHSAFRVLNNSGFLSVGSGVDLYLYRDAANTWGQRNGTNAQTFNVYNTYTSGSVYERFSIVGNGSNIDIGTYQAGATTRPLRFVVGGSAIWSISNGGHFLAVTDNVYDIGASGANRPRSGYFGTSVIVGTIPTGLPTTPNVAGFGNSWAFLGGDTVTDAAGKRIRIGVPHYTNAEEPLALIDATVGSTTSVLNIGGGTGTGNAATEVSVWTAANNTTTTGTQRWTWNSSGHFLAAADNTYDIGASGATRPRNIFVANSVTAGVGYIAANNAYFAWTGRSVMRSYGDGTIALTNAAETDFSRLQFGGTTSAFPALKRSTTALHVRLADDSAFANLAANEGDFTGRVAAFSATAIPAGGTAGAGLRVSSTANFGVFFGSGAPTLSAAKGSLYLRSDGSGTGDRMYVNTDGSTTWTAVTTAA